MSPVELPAFDPTFRPRLLWFGWVLWRARANDRRYWCIGREDDFLPELILLLIEATRMPQEENPGQRP